jgi:putative SOS response-associated peptidase YedK
MMWPLADTMNPLPSASKVFGEGLTLARPYPAEHMRVYSISTRVNSVKNDDAGLIEPMLATGGATL